MADLDLTEAVESAARALYEDAYPGANDCHAGYGALREIVARLIDGRLP